MPMLFIVFAETGLLLGFFLPGDTLLFAAGIYIGKLSESFFNVHYIVIIVLIIIASVLGKHGRLLVWKQNRIVVVRTERNVFIPPEALDARARFLRKNMVKQRSFCQSFCLFSRTFAPIVAGIVKMPKASFMLYNNFRQHYLGYKYGTWRTFFRRFMC